MVLAHFFVVVLLFWGTQCVKIDTVPVFIIDPGFIGKTFVQQLQPNPLARISSPEFADIVRNVVKNSPTVLIFVEKHFCAEDISLRDRIGTPFFHLHQGVLDNKIKYLPNVINSYQTLVSMFPPKSHSTFNLAFRVTPRNLGKQKSKHYYIFFKDIQNKTRAEVLREHDSIVREVVLNIQKLFQRPIVAFYTGMLNPMESIKMPPFHLRHHGKTDSGLVISEGALLKFSGVYTTSSFLRAAFDHTPDVEEQTWRQNEGEDFTRMTTRVSYSDFDLQLNFTLRQSDWTLEDVMLLEGGEEVGHTSMRVGVPWGRSYICWRPLLIINRRDASYIVISHYQLEPRRPCKFPELVEDKGATRSQFRKTSTTTGDKLKRSYLLKCRHGGYRMASEDDTGEGDAPPPAAEEAPPAAQGFHPAQHCEPYFTHQIFTGLMISFLCLGILSSGILMLADCSGNDTYDDPHGKPIMIAATGL